MKQYLYKDIEQVWRYMQLGHELKPADLLFVMCSNDLRVAKYAADLYHQGLAPKVLFSGGVGRFTGGLFDSSEAETFASIAKDCGVPESAILIENKSTNSGENVTFSQRLLTEQDIHCKHFILVQKPFMERRAYATFCKQWSSDYESVQVSSTQTPFFEYINEEMPLMMVLEALLDDFQRIVDYPAKGFQTEQEIPNKVMESYRRLRDWIER
ncbi:YdcF family protein [Vibrio maerlii]|uniref:YdcF family protein n=1 Tax=Vibrio maerlii TaxID=2231648 RepID=UPI000E3E9862|nr:YdcF family protein [Vibrio maerlii]